MNFKKMSLKQLTDFINQAQDLKLLNDAQEEYINRVTSTDTLDNDELMENYDY